MGMRTIYLTSALIATAIPLAPGAAMMPANDQSAASVEQAGPATETRLAGWVWEPAGFMGNGHWRSAHCAPRNAVIP